MAQQAHFAQARLFGATARRPSYWSCAHSGSRCYLASHHGYWSL